MEKSRYTQHMPDTYEHGMFAGGANVYNAELEVRGRGWLRNLYPLSTHENQSPEMVSLKQQAQELYGEIFATLLAAAESFTKLAAAYTELETHYAPGSEPATTSHFFANCSKNLGVVFLGNGEEADLSLLLEAGIARSALIKVEEAIDTVLYQDSLLAEDGPLARACAQIVSQYARLQDEEDEARYQEDVEV